MLTDKKAFTEIHLRLKPDDLEGLQIYSTFKSLPVYIILFCYIMRVTLLFTDPAGPQNFELSRNTKNNSNDCGSSK